jgi:hypothetical protein
MQFEERKLKPYAEPISETDLEEGEVYFSVTFIDDEMLIPALEPLVFVGMDLEAGDSGQVYFQDIDSYRRGVRYSEPTSNAEAKFLIGSKSELGHLFQYERALDVLLACSLRRRNR